MRDPHGDRPRKPISLQANVAQTGPDRLQTQYQHPSKRSSSHSTLPTSTHGAHVAHLSLTYRQPVPLAAT